MFEPNVRIRRLFEDMCSLTGRKPKSTTAPGFLALTEEIARVMQVQPGWVSAYIPVGYEPVAHDLNEIEIAQARQNVLDLLYEYGNDRTYSNLMKIIYELVLAHSTIT